MLSSSCCIEDCNIFFANGVSINFFAEEYPDQGDRKGLHPSFTQPPPLQRTRLAPGRSHDKGGGGVDEGWRPLRSPWGFSTSKSDAYPATEPYLQTVVLRGILHVHMIYIDRSQGRASMTQVEISPQQGVLLRRAHELLESIGQAVAEETLLRHLFGVTEGTATAKNPVWVTLLRKALNSSSLFEQAENSDWALTAWRSTHRSLSEIEFVVLDTETTGLRPGSHRVIEIAGVRIRGSEVLGSFQTLLNPGTRLPSFIVQFTGINQEMVNKAPKAAEIFPDFLNFIDGAILVGHNVGFDLGFLSYEARLLGLDFPIDGLDTIPLARRFLPALRRFKLDNVADHLKIATANRHRALGDARVTAAVFIKLLALAQQQGIQTLGHLRRRLQLPVAWNGDITQAATKKQLEQ